jgi:hypothetical protein
MALQVLITQTTLVGAQIWVESHIEKSAGRGNIFLSPIVYADRRRFLGVRLAELSAVAPLRRGRR